MKTKKLERIASLFTVFLILFTLTSCQIKLSDFLTETPQDGTMNSEEDPAESLNENKPSREPLGYSRLSETQREIYDILKSGTPAPGSSYEFDTPRDYTDVMKAIEYYYIDCSNNCATNYFETKYTVTLTDDFLSKNQYIDYSYNSYALFGVPEKGDFVQLEAKNSVKGISAEPIFSPDWWDPEQMQADFEKEAAEWMSELPSEDASDYDKAFALAELMCRKITYEHNNFADSPYGAVVGGKVVCEGYARTFQYFSRLIGLESIYVTGAAGDPSEAWESHAWNMVNIAGNWYHIDVTWMDRESALPDLTYFLKSNEFMREHNHEFNNFFYVETNEENSEILEREYPLPRANEDYHLNFAKKETTREFEIVFDTCIKNAFTEKEEKFPTDKKYSMTVQIPAHLISDEGYTDDTIPYNFLYTFNEKNQDFFQCAMISNALLWVESDYVLDDTVCSVNNGFLLPTTEFTLTQINGIPAAVYHETDLDYYDIYLRVSDNYIALIQASMLADEPELYNNITKTVNVSVK